MFARSAYQSSVDKLVSIELDKLKRSEETLNAAKGIFQSQTTQYRVNALIINQKKEG